MANEDFFDALFATPEIATATTNQEISALPERSFQQSVERRLGSNLQDRVNPLIEEPNTIASIPSRLSTLKNLLPKPIGGGPIREALPGFKAALDIINLPGAALGEAVDRLTGEQRTSDKPTTIGDFAEFFVPLTPISRVGRGVANLAGKLFRGAAPIEEAATLSSLAPEKLLPKRPEAALGRIPGELGQTPSEFNILDRRGATEAITPTEQTLGPTQISATPQSDIVSTRPMPIRSVERAPLVNEQGKSIPREELPIPTASEVAETRLPGRQPTSKLLDEFGKPIELPRPTETETPQSLIQKASEGEAATVAPSAQEVAAEKTGGPFKSLGEIQQDAKSNLQDYTKQLAIEAENQISEAANKGLIPLDQTGKINPQVATTLGRAAIGAVIGASTQDDAESKIKAAFIGAGLGAIASPNNIKRIFNTIRGLSNIKARDETANLANTLAGDIKIPEPVRPTPFIRTSEQEASRAAKIDSAKALETGTAATEPILKGSIEQTVINVAEDVFKATGQQIDYRKGRIGQQIVDLLNEGKIQDHQVINILDQYDLTRPELADLFDAGFSAAGRFLQRLSTLAQIMNKEWLAGIAPKARNQALAFLRELEKAQETVQSMTIVGRLNNIQRGMLVTQMATAMRNLETQIGRVTIDGFADIIDSGLRQGYKGIARMLGKDATIPGEIEMNSFETLLQLMQKGNKETVEKVLLSSPQGVRQYTKLFATYSSDFYRTNKDLARQLFGDQAEFVLKELETLLQLMQKGNKETVEKVLLSSPQGVRQYTKLFATYSSDFYRTNKDLARQLFGDQAEVVLKELEAGKPLASKYLEPLENLTGMLNAPNRFQEWALRRATFIVHLDAQVRAAGLGSLENIIAANEIGRIPEEALKASVNKALDVTFASQPEFGTIAAGLIRDVNNTPLSLIVRFPRFLVNSTRYLYEYNPTGFLKLLRPTEFARIAQGDATAADFARFSKALTGTALLGTAWQLENSNYSTDTWYLKCPSGDCGFDENGQPKGRTVDIRAFNPFATYSFIAWIGRKYRDRINELIDNGVPKDVALVKAGDFFSKLNLNDIAQGLLSTNFRAGAGLVVLDGFMGNLNDNFIQATGRFGAEFLAGFSTAFQQFKDFFDQFDESGFHIPGESVVTERAGARPIIPDRSKHPFTSPLTSKLPLIQQEPSFSPTTENERRREEPLLRQLSGISFQTGQNAVEQEMAKLGLKRSDILKSTGDPNLDESMAKVMGILNSRVIAPIIASPGYQALGEEDRLTLFKDLQNLARQPAKFIGAAENPEAFALTLAKRLPGSLKTTVKEIIKPPPQSLYEMIFGK